MALSAALDSLRDSLSCCTYRGDQHTHVLIQENDSLAKITKVTLLAPNGDWFSFDPDSGRGPIKVMSPLLSKGAAHQHHRACDCVVFVLSGQNLTALYIDLKSDSPSGYAGQFKSTRQFVRYALSLLEKFHGHKITLKKERFIILYSGKKQLLHKTTTVPAPAATLPTTPQKPHKKTVTNGCTLYLKELLT